MKKNNVGYSKYLPLGLKKINVHGRFPPVGDKYPCCNLASFHISNQTSRSSTRLPLNKLLN